MHHVILAAAYALHLVFKAWDHREAIALAGLIAGVIYVFGSMQ